MTNAQGKMVDTSFLRLGSHVSIRGFVHRDYLAHCLRYTHIVKFLNQHKRHKTHHLLDVGCGKEVPIARLMYSMMMTHTTGSYTGVDYGKVPYPEVIPNPCKKFKCKILEYTDFVEADLPRKKFDVITSFEVLEHVEANHAFAMMQRMREVIKKDGHVFLSTPCYDEKMGAAKAHVNEMSYEGFRTLILAAGFHIDQIWGTFASQKDYKPVMDRYEGLPKIFDELKTYYNSEIIACLFAPLFPEESRNCLWRLKPGRPQVIDAWQQLAKPAHGSSTHWPKHFRKIMKGIQS